jgi:hypothetical protein
MISEPAASRQARLARGVAGIRRRSGGVDLEKALQIAGSVLMPTGLIVILLGWWGASHTSYDFEQMPYLISGGLLGAAMTIAGGFLYFGYWLTRIVHENRRERADLVDAIGRLEDRLAGLAPSAPAAAVTLVATPTGHLVHRADCSLVQGKARLRTVDPATPGLVGCRVCDPFGQA